MHERRRKEIARYGRRGDLVRVVEDTHRGAPVYKVLFRKRDGRPSAAIYPRNRAGKSDAIAYAEGFREERDAEQPEPAAPPTTVGDLWERFVAAHFPRFRPSSKRIYRDGWKPWQVYVKAETAAETLGWLEMDGLRAKLEAQGLAVNTIRKVFGVVRQVYRWGRMTKLITVNDVGLYQYRVGKDRQPVSPDEFAPEEFERLMAAIPLDHGQFWRPHVTLGVCGHQGARQWAVLHLQWADVDHEARMIIWRREWDKNGQEWAQPLREPTIALLAIALHWREKMGYEGPWVFFPGNRLNKGQVYTEGALWRALVAAEGRAGIAHRKGRGAHGLRRLLAGEVHDLTGSLKDAMDAIGDRDIRMAQRYVKLRMDKLAETFRRLDAKGKNENETKTAIAPAQRKEG